MLSRLGLTFRTLALCAHVACSRAADSASKAPNASDTSFASVQQRGKMAMGVDQTTSTHTFDALPDGGRIELLRDVDDTVSIAQIRAHLRLIEHAFRVGDFSTPQFVHMKEMPGTAVMARKRDLIAYSYHDLPRGGEVVMRTTDAVALTAIHAFMGAQRTEHHATGAGMTMPHQ